MKKIIVFFVAITSLFYSGAEDITFESPGRPSVDFIIWKPMSVELLKQYLAIKFTTRGAGGNLTPERLTIATSRRHLSDDQIIDAEILEELTEGATVYISKESPERVEARRRCEGVRKEFVALESEIARIESLLRMAEQRREEARKEFVSTREKEFFPPFSMEERREKIMEERHEKARKEFVSAAEDIKILTRRLEAEKKRFKQLESLLERRRAESGAVERGAAAAAAE
jgi:hypothetical protein